MIDVKWTNYSPTGRSSKSGRHVNKAVWESRQEDVDVGGGAEGVGGEAEDGAGKAGGVKLINL